MKKANQRVAKTAKILKHQPRVLKEPNPRAVKGDNSKEYDYSAFKPEPAAHILGQLRKAAQEVLASEKELARLTDLMEKAQASYTHLTQTTLPNLMEQAESKVWTATDGVKVEIDEQVFASIKEENKPKAFGWLEKNNLGDLIKRKFEILFGRNDEAWAKKFQQDLKKRKKPLNSKVTMTVHPQTLNKNVKDILEEGKLKLPLETFGVFRRKVAKVTVPEK